MDLRCEHSLLGRTTDEGLIELPCKSRFCGKKPGIVVLHRFEPKTGELVETLLFKAAPHPSSTERKTDG